MAGQVPEVERTAHGLRLRDTALHLEPRGRSELGFLAHARGAPATLPRRLVASAGTLALLEALQPRAWARTAALPAAFGKPFSLGPLELTLLPAGHLRGSAQLLCSRQGGAGPVLYSGDLGGAGPTAAATPEPRAQGTCESLILRATYGHPRSVFPPRAEALAGLTLFVRQALAARAVPAVLASPLGGAQEALLHLAGEGHSVRLHPAALRACQAYRGLGVALPEAVGLPAAPAFGDVLLLPDGARARKALAALPQARTCLLSGRALEPDAAARLGVDVALPLSDHAGFDQLVDYALRSGARRVLTVHGHAEELAEELRRRGLAAQALDHVRQLDLF